MTAGKGSTERKEKNHWGQNTCIPPYMGTHCERNRVPRERYIFPSQLVHLGMSPFILQRFKDSPNDDCPVAHFIQMTVCTIQFY